MSEAPSDSLLEFPCDFPIKAFGEGDDFEALIVGLVRTHAPDLDPARVRVAASRTGRYVAVTVVVPAHSRAQLDAIYRDLSGHARVKMAL